MIIRLLTVASLAFALAAAPAEAAKPGKKGTKGANSGRLLSRFDRDHNGTIDGQEVARVQAVFGALAALDTNKDGQLSESELASVKIPEGRKGAGKAGKKGATTTTPSTSTTSPSTTTTPKAQ